MDAERTNELKFSSFVRSLCMQKIIPKSPISNLSELLEEQMSMIKNT